MSTVVDELTFLLGLNAEKFRSGADEAVRQSTKGPRPDDQALH